MIDAPMCRAPEGCGPFGIPFDDVLFEVRCAACGWNWNDEEDYILAVRAEDEYLACEGVKESQEREAKRAEDDRQALIAWTLWASNGASFLK